MNKIIALVLVILVTGCANQQRTYPSYNYQPTAMSYEEVASFKIIDGRDCPNADTIIDRMDEQLRIKGIANANPEDLNLQDRRYNAKVRIIKWALIIGCNNPDRYAKK